MKIAYQFTFVELSGQFEGLDTMHVIYRDVTYYLLISCLKKSNRQMLVSECRLCKYGAINFDLYNTSNS